LSRNRKLLAAYYYLTLGSGEVTARMLPRTIPHIIGAHLRRYYRVFGPGMDKTIMAQVIEKAAANVKEGGGPFAAAIVRHGTIIALEVSR
jgi:hypothetical protein